MNLTFSQELNDALNNSSKIAAQHYSSTILPEHLLYALLELPGGKSLHLIDRVCTGQSGYQLSQTLDRLMFENGIENSRNGAKPDTTEMSVSDVVNRLIKLSVLEARQLRHDVIDVEHLLLAMFHNSELEHMNFLKPFINAGVTYNSLLSALVPEADTEKTLNSYSDDEDEDEPEDSEVFSSSNTEPAQTTPQSGNQISGDTPNLDKFGIDMTRAAMENRLDPVVGRDNEIERLAQILSRRKKNNPVLIGEPGVGKSAIVEGLALRIVQRKVSRVLFNKRVVSLDMASIVAGTKYRGQFEERIKAILNELSKNHDIILFIDEIHTIVGAGNAQGSMDAANMLKPALARGEIQCIGATTHDEYRQNIEKDGALERRFQKVTVEPTTEEETLAILNNIKAKYEQHHNVSYTPEALKACVTLTKRYVSDRSFPDKAIDALDEAGSRVHITNIVTPKEIEELENAIAETTSLKSAAAQQHDFEKAAEYRDKEQELRKQLNDLTRQWEEKLDADRQVVDENKVAEVVAMMTGVPVQRIAQAEGKRLRDMASELQSEIIGQDEAVEKIVKAIRRNRGGLKNPDKPIGTFMFLGPTGVGKTHLAKKLAEKLFDSADTLIRMDMSEYMEKYTVSRLIGSPPGYVGHEEGGQLTEKVRRRPYSVVLFDEIEKAHPDVFNLLLQIMDEGRLTDSLGRRVDFKNTIIILTSNIGTRQLKEFGTGVGFSTPKDNDTAYAHGVLQKALQKAFSPEFLNRIDDVIIFEPLNKESIFKIIDLELTGFHKRLAQLGYTLTISDKAKNFIAERGFDIQYGARPLKRAIQKYLEDELADKLLNIENLPEGSTINVTLDEATNSIKSEILPSESKPDALCQ
ncbi:MAG: ATP-dependent Clp protease ATP-binding subunit [Paramuribaculum sp.]|nr:ATP-dependent Clp protease ATP-binding subunit [Paramuribaculum sp.]